MNVVVPVGASQRAAGGKFDPIMLEVIRSLLIAIMDEAEINLSRTAFSPIVYEVKDYCIGLLDQSGRTIAQSRGSVPTFMADLGDSVADGLEIYGCDGIHPGDVLIMNYSDVCGQHLNNIVIYVPIHHEDELIGFVASRAHWTDVGGKISGSVCTELDRDIPGGRPAADAEGLQARRARSRNHAGDPPQRSLSRSVFW